MRANRTFYLTQKTRLNLIYQSKLQGGSMILKERIEDIKKRIVTESQKAGRNSQDVTLLGVTKTKPVALIEEALESGIEFIGENKVQEASEKVPLLNGKFKEFHFIGHLQSNKINKLLSLNPILIHSIDKISTAIKLNDSLIRLGRMQDILIQVNTSNEDSKFGINPDDVNNFVDSLKKLSQLNIIGLMTIGKLTDNKDEIRKCFKMLKDIFDDLKKEALPAIKHLSMGMSHDFEIAIQEGATIIRVGSAIFGERNY